MKRISLGVLCIFFFVLVLSTFVAARESTSCPKASFEISYGTEDMVYSEKDKKLVDPTSQNLRACTDNNKDVAFEGCKEIFPEIDEVSDAKLDARCNEECRSKSEGRCGGVSQSPSFRLIDESCEKYYDYNTGESLYSFQCVAHVDCDCSAPSASTAGVGDGEDTDGAPKESSGETPSSEGAAKDDVARTESCGAIKKAGVQQLGEFPLLCEKRSAEENFDPKQCGIDFNKKCSELCATKERDCRVESFTMKKETRSCTNLDKKRSVDTCSYDLECSCVKDVKTASRAGVPEFSIVALVMSLMLALTALLFVRR